MSELDPRMKFLAQGMIDEDIVKFGGPFSLKDKRKSVAYVNARDMISLPDLFILAVNAYRNILVAAPFLNDQDGNPRFISGVPEAATLFAGAVAYKLRAPLIQHRVKPKEHGQPRPVEGRFNEGDEVILLDDVITGAVTKIEEVTALEEQGLKPVGVAVLVDRQQGGRSELESRGLDVVAVMTLSALAKYALDERRGSITQTMYDELLGELDPKELSAGN